MLEPSPELSSDLEWMLQSSQVDEETLIDALIHEYGDPTFRIALAFLGDAEAARQALVQVLSAALLNAYRYRNKQEVRTWFFQTALETLQAYERQSKRYQQPDEAQTMDRPSLPSEGQNVDPAPVQIAVWRSLDSLPANVRLLLVLQFVSGWSIAMIAATLMLSQQKVAENMSRGLRSIRTNLGSQMLDEASLRGGDLEENLVRLVEVRWPEYADLLPDWGYVRTKALEQARHRSAARRRFNALKESLLIGIAALIFIGLVWGANRFLPEPEQAQTPPRALGANRAQKPGPTRPAATRTPRPSPTPTRSFYKRPFPMGAYYYAIPGDTLEMVAARYGTTASELARLNHLLPSQPLEIGQPLLIPGRFTPGTQPTFTPVPDVELPEPLDASASRQDIENRLSTLGDGQNYHTIWIDMQVNLYGPQSYIGPDQSFRVEVWWTTQDPGDGQGPFLMVAGPAQGQPQEAVLIEQEFYLFAQPGQKQPWYTSFTDQTPKELRIFSLFSMAWNFQELYDPLNDMKVVAIDKLDTGDALRVEKRDSQGNLAGRIWFDVTTGFPVRVERYSPDNPGQLVKEVQAIGFETNVDFPPDLFDPWTPWRGGYLRADGSPYPRSALPLPLARGPAPTRLPARQAPLDFDLTQYPLTFQFPRNYSILGSEAWNQPMIPVQLFAGDSFLGYISMVMPFGLDCQRSPDGRYLAFSAVNPGEEQPGSSLYWYDLTDLSNIHTELPFESVGPFAFSPDGSQLAFIDLGGNRDSLHVIRLPGGETPYQLPDLNISRMRDSYSIPENLIWSPDGRYLAVLVRPYRPYNGNSDEIVLVDLENGEIAAHTPVNAEGRPDLSSGDWPLADWQPEFPPPRGGLETCSTAPLTD